MKSIRKTLFTMALMLAISGMLFAATLQGVGEGSTADEAEQSAMENLAQQISTEVEVLVQTSIYDDGRNASSDSFRETSTQSSRFVFLGLEVGKAEKLSKNNYRVTVTIPESSAYLYVDAAESLVKDIDALYARLGQLSDYTSITDAQFEQLESLLTDYDANRRVLLVLDPSSRNSLDTPAVSKTAVVAARNARDNERLNALASDMSYSESLARYGYLNAEGQEALAELTENAEAQRLMVEEQNRIRREQAEASIRDAQAQFGSASKVDLAKIYKEFSKKGDFSITEAVNSIESNKRVFAYIRDNMTATLGEIYRQMKSASDDYMNNELSQPYAEILLDSLGNPTAEARQGRVQRANDYITKEIQPPYIKEAEAQFRTSVTQMREVVGDIIDDVEDINEEVMTYNSFANDELSVEISYYDNSSHMFVGEATMSIGASSISFPIEFSYEKWTGDKVPDPTSYEYDVYGQIATDWLKTLRNDSSLIMLEINFYLEPYLDSSSYGVVLTHWELIRLDTGKRIINEKISDGRLGTITISNDKINLLDFYPTSNDARSMLPFFDADGIIEKEMKRKNISKRGEALLTNADNRSMFSTDDGMGRRNLYGDMTMSAIGGFSVNAVLAGSYYDSAINEDIGHYLPFGIGAFGELHFNKVGMPIGLALAAGVDVNMITVLKNNDYKNVDIEGGTMFEARARLGLGGTYTFSDNFVSIMGYGTAGYVIGKGSINCGVEGAIAYGSLSHGLGWGFSLGVRYDFYRVKDYDDTPLSGVAYITLYKH